VTTPKTSINTRAAALQPTLSIAAAADLLARTFGYSSQLTVLPGWSDQNFRAKLSDGREAVLKISHPSERRALLELQHEVMERLSTAPTPYRFPTSIRATDGSHISRVEVASDVLFVRLLSWVDGVPFAQAKPKHLRLFESLGHMLGTVDSVLAELDPAPVRHDFSWDLRRAADQIERHGPEVGDPHRQDLLGRLAGASAAAVCILAPELRSSLIHGDANDYNVLVTRVNGQPQRATTRITCGLIDFGDTSESWIVAEPAIACAYAMLEVPDPVSAAGALVKGYHHVHPLSEPEIAALPHLILQRLLVSVSISAAHAPKDPDNPHRSVSEEPAWNLLARLDGVSMDWLHFVLRGACGFEPVPGNTARPREPGCARPNTTPVWSKIRGRSAGRNWTLQRATGMA
jgi:Ser/Thr protein kinase RdoA (MazF antagonist)